MCGVARAAGMFLLGMVLIPATSEQALAQGAAPPRRAQSSPARERIKLAEDVYKNIRVLKRTPADQLLPTMRFIVLSLGVQCSFCHVPGGEDKDDKPEKQTARAMMQMVLAINKDQFNGNLQITCYTCHRGSPTPIGDPIIADGSMRPKSAEATSPAPMNAEELLDKYVQAVGGMDAISRIATRFEKGKFLEAGSAAHPIEIYAKAPDKRLVVVRMPGNDSIVAYNGDGGWTFSPAMGPPSDLSPADLQGAKLEDDLYLASHVKHIYREWSEVRTGKVGDRDAYILDGAAPGQVPIRLFFDPQTGILLRMMYFMELPLGRLPTQLDYTDYRDVGGVKVPFRITAVRPTTRATVQLDQLQQNGPIDDSKFVKSTTPPQP